MSHQSDVTRLTNYVKGIYHQKENTAKKVELTTARKRLIDSVPDVQLTEFYCECHGDFVAKGGKIVFKDQGDKLCAYYVSHGTMMVIDTKKRLRACRRKRYITDKHADPYYQISKGLKKLKAKMEIDLLQPNDPRYKKYWGDPYKNYYAQQEALERQKWQAQKARS